MADQFATLRLEIDNQWTANEFADLFSEITLIHEMAQFSFAEINGKTLIPPFPRGARRSSANQNLENEFQLKDPAFDFYPDATALQYMRYFIRWPEVLSVKAIKFGSKGFTDFLGMAALMGKVGDFILGVTDRYLAKEDRILDREAKRQDILRKKLENAHKLLNLANKSGMDPEARRALIRLALEADSFVEAKVLDGQITHAEKLD
jgi:hypothetical protein